ncbi:hypothetical protein Scep_003505 [Stephania cephalantha]|uniref:Rapid ALkalinization Factor n=1 Tax=Stephania cephalantha TaxID=152367 RepID=A0AAP0KQR8_9MAGN
MIMAALLYLYVILMLTSLIIVEAGEAVFIDYPPLKGGPRPCLLPQCTDIPEEPYHRGCEKKDMCRGSQDPPKEKVKGDHKVRGGHGHNHLHHRKELRNHAKYEMQDQDPEWLQTNNIVVLGH